MRNLFSPTRIVALNMAIALLALILSQISPIVDLIKGSNLEITAPDEFLLSHVLGDINAYINLDIANAGGKRESIVKIECVIMKNESNSRWNLSARTYIPKQTLGSKPNPLFIGTIRLKPGDRWSEEVRCYQPGSQADEKAVREIMSKIQKDVRGKSRRQLQQGPDKHPEADQSLVRKAEEYFSKKFNLDIGNYRLIIVALSETDQILSVRGFDFWLYESSIENLSVIKENYKYGLFRWDDEQGVYPPIGAEYVRIKPITEELARQLYRNSHTTKLAAR